MNTNFNTLMQTYSATSSVFSIPVVEHHDKDLNVVYSEANRLYVPRWMFLLFKADRDPIKALDLLAERYVEDVDRRLKEKNL